MTYPFGPKTRQKMYSLLTFQDEYSGDEYEAASIQKVKRKGVPDKIRKSNARVPDAQASMAR